MEREATSVLINNYNCGGYAPRAVEGAFSQPVLDVKIIVVDDGRTDQSCSIPETYGDLAKVLLQNNLEQAAAVADAQIRLRLAIGGFSFIGEPNLSRWKRDSLRTPRYFPQSGLDIGLSETAQ